MIHTVIGDVRYALRSLAKAPTFAAAVVATIGLAVGAATTITAVVDNILLRPLPFQDSERVVALCETNAAEGRWCGASPMNVADWARAAATLESAGVARTESFVGQGSSGSYAAVGGIVTPGFFDVLRVPPVLGRLVEARDLPRGSNQVIVVSHAFWQGRLGSDPTIVGRTVMLDQKPFTVIGVLPAGAWMPDPFMDVEVWKPLTASIDNVENRSWRGFTAIGLIARGASREAMLAELDVVRAQLAAAYPEANREWGLRAVPLREHTVGDVSATLWIFVGTAVFVVLIACGNVAGLLLVRATGRVPEFAIRASLGAGRTRLVQQLMTESLVLSVIGAAAGVLLAVWTTSALVAMAPADIPRLAEVRVDRRIVLYGFALSAVIAALCGMAPARRAWRTDQNSALKGRTGTASDTRLRSAFTVLQLALALVLLFGAGLLTRSFARLADWAPGFDRENVVTAWILPPRLGDGHRTVAMMQQVRDEVAAVPGIRSAGLGSAGPLFGGEETGGIAIPGQPPLPPDRTPPVQWFDVDPHYFETLGIRTLKGRGFDASDTFASPQVAVVNETLAARFFPGEDAIGRQVVVHDHPAEIVGVVADVKPLRPDVAAPPQIYWPIQQYRRLAAFLVLRTTPGVAGTLRAVEARVAAVNPGIQLGRFVALDERMARALVRPRFNMAVVGAFAFVAVLLAAVGVYGVVAGSVASRTREFGVRLALGATPRQLVSSVMRGGLGLALAGIAVGCAGALAVGRLLTSLLHGLPSSDPLALGSASLVLVLVSLVAIWAPARRASRSDPVAALRAP